MKKLLAIAFMLMSFFTMASAQKQAEIKFDKVTIDLGTFPKSNPVRQTVFVFTNTGDAPLVINQAMASCGCTVPTYTKTPIMPGQKEKSRSLIMVPHYLPDILRRVLPFTVMPKLK